MAIQRITTKVIEENSVTWTKLSTDVQSRMTTGVNITGGTISGLTAPLPVASGGTGASTTDQARINLGVIIGADVQQYDADLYDISVLDKANGNMIISNGTKWIVQTPTQIRTTIDAQPHHSYLDDISGTTASDRDILVFKNLNWVVEKDDIFRSTIGCEYGVDVHAFSSHIDKLNTLSKTAGGFVVANGSTWVVESGATARTTLGLTIGTDVQAYSAQLDSLTTIPGSNEFAIGTGTEWSYKSGLAARNALGLGNCVTLDMGGTGSTNVAYANHTHDGTNFWDQYTNGTSITSNVPFNDKTITNVDLSDVTKITFDNSVKVNGIGLSPYINLTATGTTTGIQFNNSLNNAEGYVVSDTNTIGFKDKDDNWAVRVEKDVETELSVNNTWRARADTSGLNVNGRVNTNDTYKVDGITVIESDAKIDWDKIKNVPNLGNVQDVAYKSVDVSGWKTSGSFTVDPSSASYLNIADTTGWTFKVTAALRGVSNWRKSYSGDTSSISMSTSGSGTSWTITYSTSGNYKTTTKGAITVICMGWKT